MIRIATYKTQSATPTQKPRPPHIAIIGAGMAGLSCARKITESCAADVTLYEASNRVGGRLETVSINDSIFDPGAQFLTCHDPAFQNQLDKWQRQNVIDRWDVRFTRHQHGRTMLQAQDRIADRYVGVNGMAGITRHMAKSLTIKTAWTLKSLTRLADADFPWQLHFNDAGNTVAQSADIVILAIPAPDALPFLHFDSTMQMAAAQAEYAPCWSVMLSFDHRLALGFDAVSTEHSREAKASLPDSPDRHTALAWACRESSKPGRMAGDEHWILHATPEWSAGRITGFAHDVAKELISAFRYVADRPISNPVISKAILYPQARVTHAAVLTDGQGCLYNPSMGLGATGDWCIGASAERAWLSGQYMADRVLQHLARPSRA